MSRRASLWNKRDGNERQIISALASMGVDFTEDGPLDGWIFLGQWVPVEIKNPLGRNRLQKSQADFIAACKVMDRPHLLWRSEQDAIDTVNLYRSLPDCKRRNL